MISPFSDQGSCVPALGHGQGTGVATGGSGRWGTAWDAILKSDARCRGHPCWLRGASVPAEQDHWSISISASVSFAESECRGMWSHMCMDGAFRCFAVEGIDSWDLTCALAYLGFMLPGRSWQTGWRSGIRGLQAHLHRGDAHMWLALPGGRKMTDMLHPGRFRIPGRRGIPWLVRAQHEDSQDTEHGRRTYPYIRSDPWKAG